MPKIGHDEAFGRTSFLFCGDEALFSSNAALKGFFTFEEVAIMDFITIYNRVSPRIRRIAMRHKSRLACVDEDDLYQEMCKHMWEHYRYGAGEDVNDYYIARGCEFHILNYLRTKKEKAPLSRLEDPINENGNTLKDIIPDGSEEVHRMVDRKITIDTIMNNGFTKREKEVFGLLLKGYTTREAGEQLGISHVMVVKSKKNLIKKWQRKERKPTCYPNEAKGIRLPKA